MHISQIIKYSNYKLTQFSQDQIWKFEEGITIKDNKGKDVAYCICLVRKKEIKITPEEAFRQLYLMVLKDHFGFSKEFIELACKAVIERLLDVAKKAVEVAIEKHEDMAIKFI